MFDGKSERRLAYEQVECAAELPNKDGVDAKALGMEMLASMTGAQKSSAVTYIVASNDILRGYIVVDHVNDRDNNKAVTLNMESLFAPLVESSSNGEAGMEEEDADEKMTLFSSPYLIWRGLLPMKILEMPSSSVTRAAAIFKNWTVACPIRAGFCATWIILYRGWCKLYTLGRR
jgi:hypothetical protein